MQRRYFIQGVTAICLFAGCEGIDWFIPPGDNVEGILSADTFSVVNVRGLFNIQLVEDSVCYVEYSCGINLADNIVAKVIDDTLDLYNNNGFSFIYGYEKVNLTLHYKNIRTLDVFESSYFYSTDTLHDNFCMSVRAEIAEADLTFNNYNFCFYNYPKSGGRYVFKGKTANLFFLGYYTAQFTMDELECTNAYIEHHSVNDYVVFVTDKLTASTYFNGNLYYKGNPEVKIDTIVRSGGIFQYHLK